MRSLAAITALLVILLSSCQEGRVYDTTLDIKDSKWNEQQVLSYSFSIDNPDELYNIYYDVRYTNDYPFYNLYVTHVLCDSTGKELGRKLNQMDIFWPKNGEPKAKGGGFAGTYDLAVLAFEKYKFPYKGKYNVKLMQYMRKNPLEGISAFGLRIDKYKAK